MKTLLFGILFLLSSLAACADDTIYFLGADRGVYMDAGNGLRRVGLGTGNSLAVHAGVLYLAGDDGQVWSADQRGRWLPISGTSQAKKVVVDPQGTLFILGSDGGVYRYSNGMSRRGLAVASDLAVSGNGDLYVVGTDGKVWVSRALLGGKDIWTPYNLLAQGKKVAVANDGTVYLIGTDNGIYRIGSTAIDRLGVASGQEIAVSDDGQVGIVGTDSGVYLWNGGSRWSRLGTGTARAVIWAR